MLDVVRRRVDHARHQYLLFRNPSFLCCPFPHGPFMRVPRVGGLEQDRGRFRLQHDAEDLREVDVVRVWTFVVAPAHVHAQAVGGNVHERGVERFHLLLRLVQELRFAQVLEAGVACHGEVGAVDLQHETCGYDRFILGAHRRGDGLEVGRVRRVKLVRLEGGYHTGRGGIHEGVRCGMCRERRAEIGEVEFERRGGRDLDRPGAALALEVLLAGDERHLLAVLGEGLQVERGLARTVSRKAREPVLDVGGVADLAEFAVTDDVDADGELLRNRLGNRFAQHGLEVLRVHRFAEFLLQ